MGTISGPPMRRGDIVVIADRDGGDYSGKPRPAVVVQSDVFAETGSIVVCLLTTQETGAPLLRIPVMAGEALRRSRNIPALRLMGKLKDGGLYRYLLEAGVRMDHPAAHYGMSLTLGSAPASMEEIDSLPGIVPKLARRIIEGRPYTSVEDLRKIPGLGGKTWEELAGRVVVGP